MPKERGGSPNFAKGMFRGFAKGVLKAGVEAPMEQMETFGNRDESEQAELFFELHSLVSERRDLQRTLRDYERSTSSGLKRPDCVIRKISGRRVAVPVSSEGRNELYKQKAIDAAKKRIEEIGSRLQELGSIPGFEKAYEMKLRKTYVLMRLARDAEELRTRDAELQTQINAMNREAIEHASAGVVTGVGLEERSLLEKEMKKNNEKLEKLNESLEGQQISRFLQIREYASAMQSGRIVEFPTARTVVEEGLENMRNHQPFMLAGHLGSGKTALAEHMAKIFMIENGFGYDPTDPNLNMDELYDRLHPEFFSGGDEASIYDLVGKLKLVGRSASDSKKLAANVKEISEALGSMEGEYSIPDAEIAKMVLGRSDVTETVFNYGPLGRAIRDGVPIIIDEINLIPPEVLGRINQVLLRGVGSKERLQENGEEPLEIKPGFVVLATCNLGAQYSGIKEVNAAFKSRWIAKEVVYPDVEETFDLVLAELVRKDRVQFPPDFPKDALESLVDLAVAVREIQEVFSGQTESQRFMAMARSAAPEIAKLEKAVVSTRDLVKKIIKPWKAGHFRESLDDIVARNILAAEVWSKDDQNFMTELFIRRGFFRHIDKETGKTIYWTEKDFRDHGIHTIHQQEINALQAQADTEEYKAANKRFDDLRTGTQQDASLMSHGLMIGVKGRRAA